MQIRRGSQKPPITGRNSGTEKHVPTATRTTIFKYPKRQQRNIRQHFMGSNGKNSKTGVAVAAITESCSRNRRKLKKNKEKMRKKL